MGARGSSSDVLATDVLQLPDLKQICSDVSAFNDVPSREERTRTRSERRRMRRRARRARRAEAQDEAEDAEAQDEEEGVECPGLEPFFFDEAAAVAEHEERTRRKQEQMRRNQRSQAAERKIRMYDPKRGEICITRIDFVDLGEFDLDEESPLGPMRHTDAAIDMVDDIFFKLRKKQFLPVGDEEPADLNVKTGSLDVGQKLPALYCPSRILSVKYDPSPDVGYTLSLPCCGKNPRDIFFKKIDTSDPDFWTADVGENIFFPCNSANVLSVKIVSSDVGFPINVYGTVIARDMLDRKCVYLFRCDRDHSQLILTKEEHLTLTGPKRGLALIDAIYIEIDLKIKGVGKQKKDKQLSKGFFQVDGTSRQWKDDVEVESYIVDTMLSDVEVMYAVEKHAVEATIEIEVVQGKFFGEITACTTNIPDSLVLHASTLMSAEMTGTGVIPLLRRVVAVDLKEKLIVTIARAGVCKDERERTIKFTPSAIGRDKAEVICGSVKMLVKVTWSIISDELYWCVQSL